MKRYLTYHTRWQVSAIVMMPILYMLEPMLPLWAVMMCSQAFGAFIFYPIDKWIFKEKKKNGNQC